MKRNPADPVPLIFYEEMMQTVAELGMIEWATRIQRKVKRKDVEALEAEFRAVEKRVCGNRPEHAVCCFGDVRLILSGFLKSILAKLDGPCE